MTPPFHPTEPSDFAALEAHHGDNQRRFIELEKKLDANTDMTKTLALDMAANSNVTKKLAADTADLVEMWRDAGVFFKWMRRGGALILWIGGITGALGAMWVVFRYGGPPK